MGLTDKPHPDSKATQDWETNENPLGIGLNNSSGNGSGSPSSKDENEKQSAPVSNGSDKNVASSGGIVGGDNQGASPPGATYPRDAIREVHRKSTKLNSDKQSKHIPGSKYYQDGKSILLISLQEAQELVNQFAGTGRFLNPDYSKERIEFGKVIGIHIDPDNGVRSPTTIGIIHYSRNGTHIVPAEPRR